MSAAQLWARDGRAWAGAALGVAALLLLFRPEAASAIVVWNASTAYSHCWLVLPIAAWLIWDRREAAAAHPARPAPLAVLLCLPLLAFWAAADLLGITEGRQIAAVLLIETALLAALGPAQWAALSAGFLYLLFLVPFGAFLTPALQHFTARSITSGLTAAGIPFEADAYQITIPEGVFYVAEACAGLRFLIASIAFGVLYAVTMFRSPWRRAAFIAVACVTPVLANGVRGFGIVLLGHLLGSAEAGAADHLIYGWVFFSAVLLLLAVAGLPFRQAPAPVPPPPANRGRAGTPTGWAALLASCAVPVLLAGGVVGLARGGEGQAEAADAPTLPASLAGCAATGTRAAGGQAAASYACAGGERIDLIATAMARRARPERVLDAARRPALEALGRDVDTELWSPPGEAECVWMLARARDTGRVAAYAVRVGPSQGVGGLALRLRLLRGMADGHAPLPVSLAARLTSAGGADERVFKAALSALSSQAPEETQAAAR